MKNARKTAPKRVTADQRYLGARLRHTSVLRQASDLGTKGRSTWSRDELHDRLGSARK